MISWVLLHQLHESISIILVYIYMSIVIILISNASVMEHSFKIPFRVQQPDPNPVGLSSVLCSCLKLRAQTSLMAPNPSVVDTCLFLQNSTLALVESSAVNYNCLDCCPVELEMCLGFSLSAWFVNQISALYCLDGLWRKTSLLWVVWVEMLL